MSIIITSTNPSLSSKALLLAEKWDLNFVENPAEDTPIIMVTDHGVGLTDSIKNPPIYVDFASSKNNHRRKSNQSEFIIKATGLMKLNSPIIVDATAGMGQDSFVIASKGHKIHMMERSRVVQILLEDGIMRARLHQEVKDIANRMIFLPGDAKDLLDSINPDIIYLDPMFPSKCKNAASKKEMQLFKMIVGGDLDADELLELSLKKASYRVVVKRPIKSSFLGEIKPNFQLIGNSSRFDIYHLQ